MCVCAVPSGGSPGRQGSRQDMSRAAIHRGLLRAEATKHHRRLFSHQKNHVSHDVVGNAHASRAVLPCFVFLWNVHRQPAVLVRPIVQKLRSNIWNRTVHMWCSRPTMQTLISSNGLRDKGDSETIFASLCTCARSPFDLFVLCHLRWPQIN